MGYYPMGKQEMTYKSRAGDAQLPDTDADVGAPDQLEGLLPPVSAAMPVAVATNATAAATLHATEELPRRRRTGASGCGSSNGARGRS